MEHKINTGGQTITIIDNQDLLRLSELLETEVEIEDTPADIEDIKEYIQLNGYIEASL